MNKQEAKLRAKIVKLERQKERDESYFKVICEALKISHCSNMAEILTAIDKLNTLRKEQ